MVRHVCSLRWFAATEQIISILEMPAEIINDVPKLNEQLSWFKDIPVVSNFIEPQCLDNYYQMKMEVTPVDYLGGEELNGGDKLKGRILLFRW
jgi:hypothetical protein